MTRAPMARLGVALGLAALLAGCTIYPGAQEVTSAPHLTYSDAPTSTMSSSARPTGTSGELVAKQLWHGAKGYSDLVADIDGGLVALGGDDKEGTAQLQVVDPKRGKVLWDTAVRRPALGAGGSVGTTYPGTLKVVADAGLVLAAYGIDCPATGDACQGQAAVGLAAFDLRTGAVRWTRELRTGGRYIDDFVDSTGVRIAGVDGGMAVVTISPSGWASLRGDTNDVAGLDLETGKVRWRAKGYAAGPVADGTAWVNVASDDPSTRVWYDGIGVAALGVTDGRVLWKRTEAEVVARTPVAVGAAYLLAQQPDGDRAILLDARTGATVRDLGDGNNDCRAATATQVICLDSTRERIKRVDLDTGEQDYLPVPARSWNLFAVVNGVAFLTSDTDSRAIELAPGAARLATTINSAAILAGDRPYVVLATARAGYLSDPASDGPASIVTLSYR